MLILTKLPYPPSQPAKLTRPVDCDGMLVPIGAAKSIPLWFELPIPQGFYVGQNQMSSQMAASESSENLPSKIESRNQICEKFDSSLFNFVKGTFCNVHVHTFLLLIQSGWKAPTTLSNNAFGPCNNESHQLRSSSPTPVS